MERQQNALRAPAARTASNSKRASAGKAKSAMPRTRDAQATRRDILNVSVEEFAEKGLSGARIDEIAARTNTSKRMIYYYFGNKEGLYIAVLELVYEIQRGLESNFDYSQLPPEAAMRKLVGHSFDHHLNSPNFIRIVMDENLHRARHVKQSRKIRALNVSIIDMLREIVARGAREGVFRSDIDIVDLHLTISALCFHYIGNRHTFSSIFPIDMTAPAAIARRREIIIQAVVDSLLTRP